MCANHNTGRRRLRQQHELAGLGHEGAGRVPDLEIFLVVAADDEAGGDAAGQPARRRVPRERRAFSLRANRYWRGGQQNVVEILRGGYL